MTRLLLPPASIAKWRLFCSGNSWRDRLLLLKFSLRHHLKKVGCNWEWTGREVELTLQRGRHRWQLRCLDDPGHLSVFREIFGDQQYRFPSALKKLETVVDLGANIGGFVTYVGLHYPSAIFHCVEADLANFSLLQHNLRPGASGSVALCRAVVGAGVDGPVTFYRSPSPASHSLHAPADGDAERVEVESIDLERLMEGIKRVDLLKCDIEGAEAEVLGTMTEAVARRISWIVVEYHSQTIRGGLLASLDPWFAAHAELPINACNGLLWLRSRNTPA